MKAKIKAAVAAQYDDVKKVCSSLYENPEVAMKEVQSVETIIALLKEKGFEIEESCAGLLTAFKATKKNGNGPKVAIPIEYDALPGIGHACGHHLISAMSLTAGIALAEILDTYEGEVTLFGTPGEETGEGKPPMVEAGYFDAYDAGIMLHPASLTYVEPTISSIGVYDITFTGKTAHCGAAPFEGISALDAVVMMYNGVSVMRQQMRDGTRLAANILDGGKMINSIPDMCKIRYEIRTLDMEYYDHVLERLENCAKAAALATGCGMHFELSMPICSSLVADKMLAEKFKGIMVDFGVTEAKEKPEAFATDMGEVNEVIPTLHPLVQVSYNNESLHTQEFLEACNENTAWEDAKKFGEMLALLGLSVFEDKELLMHLREEKTKKQYRYNKRRGGAK